MVAKGEELVEGTICTKHGARTDCVRILEYDMTTKGVWTRRYQYSESRGRSTMLLSQLIFSVALLLLVVNLPDASSYSTQF